MGGSAKRSYSFDLAHDRPGFCFVNQRIQKNVISSRLSRISNSWWSSVTSSALRHLVKPSATLSAREMRFAALNCAAEMSTACDKVHSMWHAVFSTMRIAGSCLSDPERLRAPVENRCWKHLSLIDLLWLRQTQENPALRLRCSRAVRRLSFAVVRQSTCLDQGFGVISFQAMSPVGAKIEDGEFSRDAAWRWGLSLGEMKEWSAGFWGTESDILSSVSRLQALVP